MSNYRLTPVAKANLVRIWNYTVKKWGAARAEKYLLDIETQLELLADNPEIGRHRPEIRDGYYSFPVARHIIFYMKAIDCIQIIGVLHGKMDVNARLL